MHKDSNKIKLLFQALIYIVWLNGNITNRGFILSFILEIYVNH